MNEMETIVKGLQDGLAETRQDVKELQSAMVGSVDGTKKGFAQQLLAVMKEMDGFTTRMAGGESRITTLETKQTRQEGAYSGVKVAVVVFWSVISLVIGVVLALLFHK